MEIDIVEYMENLTAVTAEKERIGAELNVSTQIQADMPPNIFPAFPDRSEFDIYATMEPAKEVGGDFYDFFLMDEDHPADQAPLDVGHKLLEAGGGPCSYRKIPCPCSP